MPIRLRLALIVATGLGLLLVGSGWAFVHQLRGSLDASVDSGLWSIRAGVLANALGHSGEPPTGATQVFAATGQLVSSTREPGEGPLLTPAEVRHARSGPIWLTRTGGGNDPTRILAFPLPVGSIAAVAAVTASLDLRNLAIAHVRNGFLIGGPVIVFGGALAAWLLAGAALRPVERMRRQAAAASDEGTGPVLDVPGTRDEMTALARTMNQLLDRLRLALARERAFVADAGHELRTPLSILRTELELAARPGRSRAELVSAVQAAVEETDRLTRLAESLLTLARGDDDGFLRLAPTDVAALLQQSTLSLSPVAKARGVRLAVEVHPAALTVDWDPDRIRQAVVNLVDNALRHTQPGGSVTVTCHGSPTSVVLRVLDDGPGFPPEFLPHAFERFRRADDARSPSAGGSGLGLSIVAVIARAHGGRVEACNRVGGGAEVIVEFPGSGPLRDPGSPPAA
ncbi:MAG TPA: HAMP domain-containing sensor histidine kinase [Mycobacteriales bacterium]|nr:HAMP domain-containing sensor histidine kinase [Mycobacteriales bacterium]